MDERNPRSDSEDIGRTSEEDVVGSSQDELEDVDEIDDADESDDDEDGVEDLEK